MSTISRGDFSPQLLQFWHVNKVIIMIIIIIIISIPCSWSDKEGQQVLLLSKSDILTWTTECFSANA